MPPRPINSPSMGNDDHSHSSSSWNDHQDTVVASAVQQWERRNSQQGTNSPQRSEALNSNRQPIHGITRPSYPPPAPSSGAGVRRYSAPYGQEVRIEGQNRSNDPLHQSISQPISSFSSQIPSPYIERENDSDPYLYGYTERHIQEDEEVYAPLKQSYDRASDHEIPVLSPSSKADKSNIDEQEEYEKCHKLQSQYGKVEQGMLQSANRNGLYSTPMRENIYVGGESAMNPNSISGHTFRSRFSLPLWITSKINVKQIYRQIIWLFAGVAIAWVPGLVAILCYGALNFPLYAYPTCFGVGLFWWSVWFSSAWVGIWICWLASLVAPIVMRISLGILAINFKRQITYLEVLQKYVATLLWSVLIWITYLTIVWMHFPGYQGIDSSLLDPLSAGNSTIGKTNSTSSSSDSILNSLWGTGSTSSAHTAALQAEAELSNYSSNANWLISFSRFFFGLAISSSLLLAQKLSIQSIANSFHEVTYSDRIRLAKYHTSVLVTLYSHAKRIKFATSGSLLAEHGKAVIADAPSDSIIEPNSHSPSSTTSSSGHLAPMREGQVLRTGKKVNWAHFRNTLSLRGRSVPTIMAMTAKVQDIGTPPIAFTNPFSPEAIVETSLESSDETKKLAKRIFDAYSVSSVASDDNITNGRGTDQKHDQLDDNEEKSLLSVSVLTLDSIQAAFSSKKDATRAYAVLDRNGNGDCTWEEILSVCLEIHRERMCLLASMHDVDAAVAKLDHILRGVWVTMSSVIVAALLSVRFSTLIASLGTILLGLSWLISSTAQESLASIVWVFCKHPIDVGDVIVVPGLLSIASSTVTKDSIASLQGYTDGDTFEVQEVQLMSTVLKTTTTNKHVQVSNYVLSQKPLVNLRRSGPIEEPFTLSVGYDTSLESIEGLRKDMCSWISSQGRDFRPGLDVALEGLDDQSQLKIVLTIRYKSNWQDSRLRMQRRNRWISALKQLLKTHNIYGPGHVPVCKNNHSEGTLNSIKAYQLMDKSEEVLLDGRDEFELFGRKGTHTLHSHYTTTPLSGTIVTGNDGKLDVGTHATAETARSRLNQALPPMTSRSDGDAGTKMYAQHSSSTTHLDVNHAQGWHTNENDLFRQKEEGRRNRGLNCDLEMGEKTI